MSDEPQNPMLDQGHDDGPGPVPDGIPPALLSRLLELKPSLTEQGVVQRREYRTGTRWRLRVRTPHPDFGRIHTSVSLGGDVALAEAVRLLISQWRRGRAAPRKPRRRRKTPEELRTDELRREVLKASGGGWRRRKRVRREFDEAAQTPGGLTAYVFGGSYAVPRKPGRKRACALA